LKAPGFTAIAVFTLALAIGVNSAIFALVNSVVLKPLIPHKPQEVVNVFNARHGVNKEYRQFSWDEYQAVKQGTEVFGDVAAIQFALAGLGRNETMRRSFAFFASENFFSMLGTKPAIGRFFTRTFTAAVWQARRFVVISALLMFLPALAVGAWLSNSDHARDVAISPELQQAYLEEDFENYSSSEAAAAFSTKVLVNNIQVSFLAFVGGILFCVPTAYLLIFNGANVGVAAGLFHSAGKWPKFYGLILPHGILELSAIVVAGAAGLSLGWALIAPGEQMSSV
jgi:uncharacterized membrane protein SpoIIM required for sporulation